MDTIIKEEFKEVSLCVVDSDDENQDDLASSSIAEKYDRFLRDNHSDSESDLDYFPDDDILKEEYAQLKSDSSFNLTQSNHLEQQRPPHRLSTGIPSNRKPLPNQPTVGIKELIDKLAAVRKCGPDGNSVFCTEDELTTIQGAYAEILDYLDSKTSDFKETEISESQPTAELSDERKVFLEKIEAVRKARDAFHEIEGQVREQIEQLELVERYKMESVE